MDSAPWTLAVALAAVTASAQPLVSKVEPPSWWTGSTLGPVRLMIRGRGLAGAHVEGAPGLAVGPARVNAAGTYAFVDVTLDPKGLPGPRRLKVVTPSGAAFAGFEGAAAPAGLADGTALEDRLGAAGEARVSGGRIRVALPPRSAAVYVPRRRRPRPHARAADASPGIPQVIV